MHQPDSAADLSARKMAHPAMFPRRGSSSSGSGGVTALNAAGTGAVSSEDYPPPLLIQPPPSSPAVAAASSSSGPQPPPPPQSLNLLSQAQLQPQPLSQTGAQMKKKSGFQITSVTPAQISASISSNNSIAEDTESYDDLDESHTEDLSSSEILDVSLSRATDLGEPERSSSEETLNNFQEAETPGAVSPNQPHLPQQHPPLPHPPQPGVVINGNVHPHHAHHLHHHLHHHHHGHHHPSHSGVGSTSAPGGPPPSPSFRKLSTAGSSESVLTTAPVSAVSSTGTPPAAVVSNIRTTSTPGSIGVCPATGTSTMSNIGGGSVASGMLGNANINVSNITGTGNVNALSGTISSNVSVGILGGMGNGTSASSSVINNVANPTAGMAVGSSQQQPAASTSRFRVVKLDSSSEPFKKGRWTCTEFYDKENMVAVAEGVAVNKAVESIKQNPLEVSSERESTSGSSVSSNVSTLSHYTESVGSGEMGAPTVVQQQQAFQGVGPPQVDFSTTGPPTIPAPSLPQSISQPQLAQVQLHSQEVSYSQQKPGVPPAAQPTPVGIQPTPVNLVAVSSSLGHQQPGIQSMAQQQLPYTQPAQPVQAMPIVPQQQLQYAQQQQQTVPTQMAPGLVKPVNQNSVSGTMPDYIQHQQILQTPVPSMQPGSTAVPVAQAPSMQSSVQAHPAVAPTQPVPHAQTAMPVVGTSAQMMNVGQQGNVATVVQQPSVANQIAPSVMQQSTALPSSQVVPPVQTGIIQQGLQASASGLSQQMVIAPQNTLLPVQPQALEPVVQGMPSQQLPAVSPIPSASTVSAPSQPSANVSPASMSLGQPQNTAQASAVQNGNLVQSVAQPSLASTSITIPVVQNVPQQVPLSSTQFSTQSITQSLMSQIEDARRSTEPSLAGLPQATSGESGAGVSAVSDGSGSSSITTSASLFPLKVLPLATQLVDGEDESFF